MNNYTNIFILLVQHINVRGDSNIINVSEITYLEIKLIRNFNLIPHIKYLAEPQGGCSINSVESLGKDPVIQGIFRYAVDT